MAELQSRADQVEANKVVDNQSGEIMEQFSPDDKEAAQGGEMVVAGESEENTDQAIEMYSDSEVDTFLKEQEAEDDECSIPVIKIDNMSGKLVCEDMGIETDNLNVILLHTYKGRVCFPETYSKDSKPLCKSANGLIPSVDVYTPLCGVDLLEQSPCKQVKGKAPCPYGNWSADRTPPACSDTITALVYDPEENIPYWIVIMKTRMKGFKQLENTLKLRTRALALGSGKKAHKSMFRFKISTKIIKADSGDYFIFDYSDIDGVTDVTANKRSSDYLQIAMFSAGYRLSIEDGIVGEDPEE